MATFTVTVTFKNSATTSFMIRAVDADAVLEYVNRVLTSLPNKTAKESITVDGTPGCITMFDLNDRHSVEMAVLSTMLRATQEGHLQ